MWSETIEYRAYLPPYLPEFFPEAARKLALTSQESLLDLGCGPGDVALGFAPHVATLAGVDLELPMLEEARRRAREIGRDMHIVHAKAQEAPEDLGPFDLITIGTAHWFMHSPATIARIDRWLKPRGSVMICVPRNDNVGRARWWQVFMEIRYRWSRAKELYEQMRLNADEFFRGSHFVRVGQVETNGQRTIDLDYLLKRALAFPTTSRAILGADAEPMLAELRTELAPFFANGPIVEWHCTAGAIYRRRQDA